MLDERLILLKPLPQGTNNLSSNCFQYSSSPQKYHHFRFQAMLDESSLRYNQKPFTILSVHRLRISLALLSSSLLTLLIYYSRLDHIVGQVRDDAWYVLLAKSLATGQGYQLINSPIPDILP